MTIPGARLGTSAATAAALLLTCWGTALAEPRTSSPGRAAAGPLATQVVSARTAQGHAQSQGTPGDRAARAASATAAAEATTGRGPSAADGSSRDRYIVVYRSGRRPRTAAPATLGVHASHVFRRVLNGYAATLTTAQLTAARSDPAVAYVEPDRPVHAWGTQTPAGWGLDRLDQRTLPLNNSYTYPYDGTGITAYVIDSGLRATHTEFTGRVGTGRNFVGAATGGDTSTDDCDGHGTHVAGSLGGSTYGVAKNVTIVPVRVLDCEGSGFTSDVISGVEWVTNNHSGPSVANMSLGGNTTDAALDAAIQTSINAGVTYAVAAGNDSVNACTQSPADLAAAITVGATDPDDSAAVYSNYGTCVDLYAPGTSIPSAGITSDTATATMSGTSMASPHVAGLAAQFLQAHPGSTPSQVGDYLKAYGVHGLLTQMLPGDPNVLAHVPSDDEAPFITAIARRVSGLGVTATVTATDYATGLHGFSYTWSTRPTATTTEVDTVEDTTSSTMSATLAQGIWYLHVRAVDSAGNWTGVANSATFVVDVAAPRLTLLRVKPASTNRYAVTVGATDNVGLASIHVVWNRVRTSVAGGHQVVAGPGTVLSPTLGRGSWYVHVAAVDRAGHVTGWATAGPYTSPLPFVRGAVTQGARCPTRTRGYFGFTRSHVLERCSRTATNATLRWRRY